MKAKHSKPTAQVVVKDIRRATRKQCGAEEKIRIVERSHLPAKQTLDRLGIARPTFYRWYDLYLRFGEDGRPGPRRG